MTWQFGQLRFIRKCVSKMSPRPQTGHFRVSALRISIELDGVAIGDILSRRSNSEKFEIYRKYNHRNRIRVDDIADPVSVRRRSARFEARGGRPRLRSEIGQVAHRRN